MVVYVPANEALQADAAFKRNAAKSNGSEASKLTTTGGSINPNDFRYYFINLLYRSGGVKLGT